MTSGSRRCAMWLVLLALALPFAPARAADPQPGLAQVEARISAAEGVRAVKRLQNVYAHMLDEGRWSDLADLLTADVYGQFGTVAATGREGIKRHVMDLAGRRSEGLAAGQLNTHLIMQPIITLGADGRTAKGTWHELALLGRFGKEASWRGGVYENEYRLEGGTWKISRIHYIEQYRGAYEEYGHKAPPAWNIPYHFEAAHVGVTIPQSAIDALAATPGAGSDAARHAAASRRVEALHDESAVQNLQHAFGYYLDRKLWDDVADLFAASGSFESAGRGAYVGRERIRRALESFHGPSPLKRGELFDHLLTGTVVSVAPDGMRAAARTVQLAQLGQTGEFARWELGVYENQFVKEQGKWKLQAVRYFPRVSTDYDLGWAADAQPVPAVSREFPPDRKPVAFASYPKLHSVAPHFMHPVTGRALRGIPGPAVGSGTIAAARPKPPAAGAAAATSQQIAALDVQVAREIGVDAVENLNSSYGYYIDESDWNGMADTYSTSYGAKELTGAGVYLGRERIRNALNLRGPAGGRSTSFFTIHQLIQPVITVADDGFSAKARLRLFQGGGNADGSSGSWIGGIYENTAVFENGEWKFGIQDLHHLFNASYRNGWGRAGGATLPSRAAPAAPQAGAVPQAGAAAAARNTQGGGITQGLGGARSPSSWSTQYPPDRAIRARQYAFPEITEPAFHYVNPVSGRVPKEMMPEYPVPKR